MREVQLDPVFAAAWRGRDAFEAVQAINGKVMRAVKNRRTLHFEINGSTYYLKLHQPAGWGEILRSLLRGSLPVLSARSEWRALERLRSLGLAVPETAACGQRGCNPAARQSFIITRALENTVSLEDYTAHWKRHPPPGAVRRALLKRVAIMARTMHDGGVNHRDFYLCHFFLDCTVAPAPQPHLYLMDLHRAQLRPRTPARWVIKDLGGLYFSAMHIGLSNRDLLRFVRIYSGLPLGAALGRQRHLWQRVRSRAAALHREAIRKGQLPAGANRP